MSLWRWRHPVQDEEQEFSDPVETSTDESEIQNAITNLAQRVSLPNFIHVSAVEAYLSEATNPFVVNINPGLFHAWWARAVTWVGEPDNPDKANQIVENLAQHGNTAQIPMSHDE